MKNLIVDLFNREDIVNFIKSIKEVDIDIITYEVFANYENPTLDDFINEAFKRYYAIVATKNKYKLILAQLEFGLSDLDNYVDNYCNGNQSYMEFSVESFTEDYGLEGKLKNLAYQLKTELENFKN